MLESLTKMQTEQISSHAGELNHQSYAVFESTGNNMEAYDKCQSDMRDFQLACERAGFEIEFLDALPAETSGYRNCKMLVGASVQQIRAISGVGIVIPRLLAIPEFSKRLDIKKEYSRNRLYVSVDVWDEVSGLAIRLCPGNRSADIATHRATREAVDFLFSVVASKQTIPCLVSNRKPQPVAYKEIACPRCGYPEPDKRRRKGDGYHGYRF